MGQSIKRMKKKIHSKGHLACKMLLSLISFLQLKARTHMVQDVPMDLQINSFLTGFHAAAFKGLCATFI